MEVVTSPVVRQNGASAMMVSSKAEANKCDLCHTRENGPACVETCPTNALKLIDRNAMQDLINEKRRRAALDTTIDFMF